MIATTLARSRALHGLIVAERLAGLPPIRVPSQTAHSHHRKSGRDFAGEPQTPPITVGGKSQITGYQGDKRNKEDGIGGEWK